MKVSGEERLGQFMALVDEVEHEIENFGKLLREGGAEAAESRTVGRLERMQRGVINLRNEAEERLDAAGFGDRVEDRDQHYSDVRHDLRNRLNPVSLACQGLMRSLVKTDGGGEGLEALDRIQGLILESLKLIDRFGVLPNQVLIDIEPADAGVRPHGRAVSAGPAVEEAEDVDVDADSGAGVAVAAGDERGGEAHGESEAGPETFPQAESGVAGSLDTRFKGRLLVVDDAVDDREELVETLREAGHTVVSADDGHAALRELESEGEGEDSEFDVVLLDLSMPGMDGKAVLRELRRIGKLKYLPVIVVTGRRGEDDAVECITIGAEGFLTKPVRSKLLLAEVDRCLEKRRLREREFEQFFPPAVARHFARHPDSSEMEARQAEVSVLFCDIRGFSGISERLGGSRTVPWLRDVLECLSQCVVDHEGVLVDYTGDEVMAMWGAPREIDDHAERACSAALAMLATLPGLNERWQEEIGCETSVGIGVNSGLAQVGNIGTRRKLKYGPLGNTVNLASRVQGASSYVKTRLIVTRETRDGLSEAWHPRLRRLCDVRVKNILEPVRLFELSGEKRPNWALIKADYEKALGEFQNEQFPESLATLGNLLRQCPDDGPSLLLMGRVVEAMSNEHMAFDPVWFLPGK